MESQSNYIQVQTEKEFNQLLLNNFDKLFVALFFADWHEPSVHLTNVAKSLAKSYEGKCIFVTINADENEAVAEKFKVELVPTIVIMKSTKEILHRIEEDSPSLLSQKVEEYSNSFRTAFETDKVKMFSKIDEIVKSFPLVIFIKGSPEAPKCGFSEQLLAQLNDLQLKFSHFDILSDENVRNWLRYYSKWVTYPQVYVAGKFVGGLDVTKDLIAKGEFQKLVEPLNLKETPDNITQRVVGSAPVLLLIEGKVINPSTPNSEEIVRIVKDNGIRFSTYDVEVASEEIKNSFKEKFGVQEFPALIVEKQYIGGLEKIRELSNAKELVGKVPKEEVVFSINEKLKALVNSSPVMIFIKGVPEAPQCGFSRKIVDLLNKFEIEYGSFNILNDNTVRERLKEYSNWKTYPQLYIEGELVGGLDIALEMDAQGELFPMVEKYLKKHKCSSGVCKH